MTPRKIIIDTDPGQDDAVAILLALGSPDEIEVLGITAVAGNVPLALTEKNTRIVCELAGRPDIPVYAGCDRPLGRPLVTAEHVHGQTGLDGPSLPDPTMPLQAQHAVDYIIDTLRAHDAGTVTLCPLGPLTNIATALQRAPDIAEKVQQIVLMGGAYFEVGNITPAAEFNIYVEPLISCFNPASTSWSCRWMSRTRRWSPPRATTRSATSARRWALPWRK